MSKYRKKPVVIEAMVFDGANLAALQEWGAPIERPWSKQSDYRCPHCWGAWGEHAVIRTLEDTQDGGHFVCPADMVICGVKGEYYACKPDIFAATYEPAALPAPEPAPPDVSEEKLYEIVTRFGAANHKAGQESVRQSGYQPRAEELLREATTEVRAAIRRAVAGSSLPVRAAPEPPNITELQGILAQAIQKSERADTPGRGRVECIDFSLFATIVHGELCRVASAPQPERNPA